jgi:hypothetical protein
VLFSEVLWGENFFRRALFNEKAPTLDYLFIFGYG